MHLKVLITQLLQKVIRFIGVWATVHEILLIRISKKMLTQEKFLAEVSAKLQKCTFLDNLRTITQEGNMETRQMTSFFSSIFNAETVCNIHFWIWKQSKFVFMWPLFWFILVCKIPQFLWWCGTRDLFGSQIPVTTGGFELRISCIRSSYLTH